MIYFFSLCVKTFAKKKASSFDNFVTKKKKKSSNCTVCVHDFLNVFRVYVHNHVETS